MERVNVTVEKENLEIWDKICKRMGMSRGQVLRLLFSRHKENIDLVTKHLLDAADSIF